MQLSLEQVSKSVSGEVHLHPLNLALQPGQVTVLLVVTVTPSLPSVWPYCAATPFASTS